MVLILVYVVMIESLWWDYKEKITLILVDVVMIESCHVFVFSLPSRHRTHLAYMFSLHFKGFKF